MKVNTRRVSVHLLAAYTPTRLSRHATMAALPSVLRKRRRFISRLLPGYDQTAHWTSPFLLLYSLPLSKNPARSRLVLASHHPESYSYLYSAVGFLFCFVFFVVLRVPRETLLPRVGGVCLRAAPISILLPDGVNNGILGKGTRGRERVREIREMEREAWEKIGKRAKTKAWQGCDKIGMGVCAVWETGIYTRM